MKYATPEGMEPNQEVVDRAVEIGNKTGAKVVATNDPIEAVSDAGVIYTDIFVSMGEEHLENKFEAFQGFQVNEELTDGVIDSKNSIVFDQAENRMWAQMSLLTYMCNPIAWEAYRDLY